MEHEGANVQLCNFLPHETICAVFAMWVSDAYYNRNTHRHTGVVSKIVESLKKIKSTKRKKKKKNLPKTQNVSNVMQKCIIELDFFLMDQA